MKIICSSPETLSAWFKSLDLSKFDGVHHELRLPVDGSSLNKSGLLLDGKLCLGSLTVWGHGMVEWILFDKNLNKEISVKDLEFSNKDELISILNRNVAEFLLIEKP